jgi:hypothetical protein
MLVFPDNDDIVELGCKRTKLLRTERINRGFLYHVRHIVGARPPFCHYSSAGWSHTAGWGRVVFLNLDARSAHGYLCIMKFYTYSAQKYFKNYRARKNIYYCKTLLLG